MYKAIILSVVLANIIFSQTIPGISDTRLVDWSNAGLLNESQNTADNVIDITKYSGSDYYKITAAINDANKLPGLHKRSYRWSAPI